MSDLVSFLLARLDEDEAMVRADLAYRGSGTTYRLGHPFDPARGLVDLDAKRAIVAGCTHVSGQERRPTSVPGRYDVVDVRAVNPGGHDDSADAEAILRLLALPYADAPGYDERWRP